MEVKPGYKQTEVGVIPEDWEVRPLWTLAEKIMVGIASAATHAYRDRGVVLFRNQNIKPGYLDDSDILYIAEDYEETFKNKRLKSGDLLTARTGYPGTTSIVPNKYEGAQSFTTLITRPRKSSVESAYLCCFINSEAGQLFFEQNQIGGGQKNVNAGSLKLLPVPVPATIGEQEAIAEALSDADALIESLDQLIAKKRDLKQGAMQELLTGKRRLPGFGGEWEVKRLGDVLKVRHGRSQHEVVVAGGIYPILATGGEIGRTNVCLYDKPSVLIGRKGTIDKPQYQDLPFWTVDTLFYTEIFSSAHPKFIYFKFLMIDWRSYNEASGVPSLNASTIEGIEVAAPALAEQVAIATILSDLETELAELQFRLTKASRIKQGMMQELLTGRIRLL